MRELSDNKRIAKNTVFLYIRMLLIMGVSLFTVRVVLATLGSEDYGINNVVGGVVTMFSFLTHTLVSASQRFFAFELGRKDYARLNQLFNTTLICYIVIGIIVVILAETVGLWFVKTKLVIPTSRSSAAMWVYQFSIIGFVLKLCTVPYMSIIIARERMNVYAYVSIIEVLLQLAIVYILTLISFDKLKLYAALHCFTSLTISFVYLLYSRVHFEETKLSLRFNKNQLSELLNYSWWNLLGALSSVLRSQGINILLNMFFTPVVNAARAVAFQVNNAINQLANNFFNAVKPQITKKYAAGDDAGMMALVFRSSRFSYYLIWLLAMPIFIEAPFILVIWLKDVPEYTILFTRLVIINAIIDSLSHPLMTSVQATGNIRNYQIVTAGLLLLNLPVSYVFLRLGYPPQITMVVSIIISLLAQFSRVLFMKIQLNMSLNDYIRDVLFPVVLVSFVSLILPLFVHHFVAKPIIRAVSVLVVSFVVVAGSVFFLGMTKVERKALCKWLLRFKKL